MASPGDSPERDHDFNVFSRIDNILYETKCDSSTSTASTSVEIQTDPPMKQVRDCGLQVESTFLCLRCRKAQTELKDTIDLINEVQNIVKEEISDSPIYATSEAPLDFGAAMDLQKMDPTDKILQSPEKRRKITDSMNTRSFAYASRERSPGPSYTKKTVENVRRSPTRYDVTPNQYRPKHKFSSAFEEPRNSISSS